MDQTVHGQVSCKLKGERCNPKYKTASKYSKINTYLIEYFPKTLAKREVKETKHVDIISTVFSLFLCQSQTQYQTLTTIKYNKLIVLQLIYQHLLIQTNILFLMKLVIRMTVQNHIRALILAGMSTNQEELVKVNGYGAIAAKDEAANIFYIFRFISVPYTLQKYMESLGDQLSSGELI